jgi:hypothetical protein
MKSVRSCGCILSSPDWCVRSARCTTHCAHLTVNYCNFVLERFEFLLWHSIGILHSSLTDLKMEAASAFKMFVTIYQLRHHYIPGNLNLHLYCCENFIYCIINNSLRTVLGNRSVFWLLQACL